MNNFAEFIKPEKAMALDLELQGGMRKPLKYYIDLANNDSTCENCSEKAWKLANTGLCFSCTTGEADASEDYEIEP